MPTREARERWARQLAAEPTPDEFGDAADMAEEARGPNVHEEITGDEIRKRVLRGTQATPPSDSAIACDDRDATIAATTIERADALAASRRGFVAACDELADELEREKAHADDLAQQLAGITAERDDLAQGWALQAEHAAAVVAKHAAATGWNASGDPDDVGDNLMRLDFGLGATVADRDRFKRLHQRALAANRRLRAKPKPKRRRHAKR